MLRPHRTGDVWYCSRPCRHRVAGPQSENTPARGVAPGGAVFDVVPGRSGKVYHDWIAEHDQQWPDRIAVAGLNPVQRLRHRPDHPATTRGAGARRFPRRQARRHRGGLEEGPTPAAAADTRAPRLCRGAALHRAAAAPAWCEDLTDTARDELDATRQLATPTPPPHRRHPHTPTAPRIRSRRPRLVA